MRTSLIASILLAGLATQSFAKEATDRPSPSDTDAAKITISCYRGLVKTVAWDRANAVFLDDLRQLGYSHSVATDIGERVCRDEYGVDDHEHMRKTLIRLMRETPPG